VGKFGIGDANTFEGS